MIHEADTAKNPAPKLFPEVWPVNNAAKKAMIAIAHQGNMNPPSKESINMIRNSTLVFIKCGLFCWFQIDELFNLIFLIVR